MSISYLWNISQLDCYPEYQGEPDVVFVCHWTLTGTEIQGEKTYTGSVYGSVGVTLDPEAPFIPYDQLTQDQVLNWVWEGGVDKAASEANVAQQIEDQKNPKVVTPPLPWAVTLGPTPILAEA